MHFITISSISFSFLMGAPLFLLLLPLLLSTFHGVLAATPLYEAGNAHFSTQNDSSSNPSTFWLSGKGSLTFGFKSLGPNQYLLCVWVTADTNRTPLWWPSITNPSVTQGATLNFTSNGNLELIDANQSMVWSTSTSNASFAKLQNTGNLQLFDKTMENLQWQSFSDLRDTLVVRPREDTSISSLSSIVVDKSYLLRSRPNESSYGPPGRFHLETDQSMNVYLHAVDSATNVDSIFIYAHMNASGDFFELTRDGGRTYQDNSSVPMSMLRLDPDGNLRIYAWNASHSTWDNVWQFLDINFSTTLYTKPFVSHPKRGVERWAAIRAVVAALLVAMLVLIATTIMWRSKAARERGCGAMIFGKMRRGEYVTVVGVGGPIRFTYDQLVEATQNFGELLGEGGHGKVYKGRIIVVMENEKKASEKQLPVAVKMLKDTMGARHGEAEKQFRAEVSTLGKIHHVNLVDLVGYCIGEGRGPGKKRILVYEYIENGSVARFLSGEPEPLPWAVLYSIAVGTARGIAYLHHDCKPQILHCDIKPENVLLDHEFTAKVAGFGMARQLEEVKSNLLMMSGALRTSGYMAPEWLKTTDITSKADVYSYGIMLLGLVRRLYERANDDESLVDWAYQFISAAKEDLDHKERRISSGGEDSLNNEEYPNGQIHEYDLDNIEIPQVEQEPVSVNLKSEKHDDEENLEKIRVLKIGLWCIQYQHELRPSMLRVVQLLEGNGEVIGIPSYPAPSVVLVGYQSSSTSTNIASYMADSDVAISAR